MNLTHSKGHQVEPGLGARENAGPRVVTAVAFIRNELWKW